MMKPMRTLKNWLLSKNETEALQTLEEAYASKETFGHFCALAMAHGVADRRKAPPVIYEAIKSLQATCRPTDLHGNPILYKYWE